MISFQRQAQFILESEVYSQGWFGKKEGSASYQFLKFSISTNMVRIEENLRDGGFARFCLHLLSGRVVFVHTDVCVRNLKLR